MQHRILLLLIAVWGPAASVCHAQETELPADDARYELFMAVRRAAQNQDRELLSSLRHSAVQQCVANNTDTGFYERFVASMMRIFGHDLPLKGVHYHEADDDVASDRLKQQNLAWPIPPRGRVEVHFDKPNGARVANLHIAMDSGRWRWLHVCRNEDIG